MVQNPETGLIDIYGDINLPYYYTKIPYKFGIVIVDGNFYCNYNQLTSLEGCPKEVTGTFDCSKNKLISLKYCPEIVKGNFWCHGNQLQSAKYLPKMVTNYDYCIEIINYQKSQYLISMGFDPDNKEYFTQLMDELEKNI